MNDRFSKRPERKSPFRKKESGERNEKSSGGFRERKKSDRGNDRPFRKKESGERKNFKRDDDRPFRKKYDSTERAPYRKKSSDNDRGGRPPFIRKYSPGSAERKSSGSGTGRRFDSASKPFFKKKKFEKLEPQDDSGLIRLNKYIANTGLCSRREADQMIEAGVISVNGQVITQLGYKVKPEDEVKYHEQPLRREKMVYVLLNKPKDYITTTDDPQARKTVMELVHNACKERIYPVGRLDRSTTGLLLLTNDGELTKRLTHPSSNIKKIYHVFLDKNLKPSDIDAIREGVELEDGMAHVDKIVYVDGGTDKKEVGVELHSGKNRIVRRIFEKFGYKVVKLDRVYFAGITKKDLQRGRWRFLSEMELNMLKMQTGKQ